MKSLKTSWMGCVCALVLILPLSAMASAEQDATQTDFFSRMAQWFQALRFDQANKAGSATDPSQSALQNIIEELKLCTLSEVNKVPQDDDMPNMSIYLTAALRCAKEFQQKRFP